MRKRNTGKAMQLRKRLVKLTLDWEKYFGVAPRVTSAISELDAARLVGMGDRAYCEDGRCRTAVTKGVDFVFKGLKYQVTANRPSGKKGSRVILVGNKTEKKGPFGWDRLIWILYDRHYVIEDSREFTAHRYRRLFGASTKLRTADDMRKGRPVSRP